MPALGSVGRSGVGWNSILPVSPGQRIFSHSTSSRWRISYGRWSLREASRVVVRSALAAAESGMCLLIVGPLDGIDAPILSDNLDHGVRPLAETAETGLRS